MKSVVGFTCRATILRVEGQKFHFQEFSGIASLYWMNALKCGILLVS